MHFGVDPDSDSDPDPDSDPYPAVFVIDLQDAENKIIFYDVFLLIKFWNQITLCKNENHLKVLF